MDYNYFKKSSDYILSKIDFVPEVAIILGSALGGLSHSIENKIEIHYDEIPNFLTSTVNSHAGKLILGTLAGKKVVCMSGRFHYYEGYDFEQLVIPIRVFKLLGVQKTILTNASGAVNKNYRPGDIMVIKDHIKLMGASPLRGKNIDEFGPRFFDVSNLYTKELRQLALEVAKESKLTFHEGVYYFTQGPNFETPAEIKAMGILGADAIGMSTVTESLTAGHCNMPLLALSLISNMAAGVLEQPITTEEVDEVGEMVSTHLKEYLKKLLSKM